MDSVWKLPRGFSLTRRGRVELIMRDAYREQLMERGIHNPEDLLPLHRDKARFMEGRGLLVSLPINEKGSARMVIRHYEHGGIFRALTRDLFIAGSRPLWELIITEMARKAGVPTIEILAAIRRRVFWPIYKGDLVSKEIPNSLDLIQWLTRRAKAKDRKKVRDKRELIRQAGRLVRQIHEVGIYHRDLHLKNFIVKVEERGAGSLHIIDFDRSAIVHPLKSHKWWANLMRLDRSIEKWQPKGIWITRTDRLRFLRSYLEGDQERRALVKTYLRKYPQRRRRYTIGWAFERLLYG